MQFYSGSVSKALLDSFPDIGLEKEKLRTRCMHYSLLIMFIILLFIIIIIAEWYQVENRRAFFVNYANNNRFDHLNPINWYEQPVEKILANEVFLLSSSLFPSLPHFSELQFYKGAFKVIYYHNNKVQQALMDLFPSIGLDKSKFVEKCTLILFDYYNQFIYYIIKTNWISASWQSVETRENFFIDYAKANGFDYNDPHSWYSQPRSKIMLVPVSIINHYLLLILCF